MAILDNMNHSRADGDARSGGRSGFEVEAPGVHPGGSVLRVTGEVDLSAAKQFQAAIEEAADGGDRLVIDLSACDFIDSTAIAVMVRAHRELSATGRKLVVCSPRDQVRRVLEITGLIAKGFVVDDVEEALS